MKEIEESERKYIGVITPFKQDFDLWVREMGSARYPYDYFIFVQISKLDDIRGMLFHAVEYGYRSAWVDHDVRYQAFFRIKR